MHVYVYASDETLNRVTKDHDDDNTRKMCNLLHDGYWDTHDIIVQCRKRAERMDCDRDKWERDNTGMW